MTGRTTGSMNGNGDNMQKPKRKIHTILLGTIVLLVIIFINSSLGVIGGEKGKKEESGEFAALEEALMKIEGIGEISYTSIMKMENLPIRYPITFQCPLHRLKREMSCKAFLLLQKARKTSRLKTNYLKSCQPSSSYPNIELSSLK